MVLRIERRDREREEKEKTKKLAASLSKVLAFKTAAAKLPSQPMVVVVVVMMMMMMTEKRQKKKLQKIVFVFPV